MRKIIALTLVLFSITYTQAQVWINNESTILFEQSILSNEKNQCIENYRLGVLLTTTNMFDTDLYSFRAWVGSNTIVQRLLNDANCVVSDIEILRDSVYFCGNREVNGNQVGYIGRFNMEDFVNNLECNYEIMDIDYAINLKKLVAYDTFGKDHVVAIGSTTSNTPVIVDLFPDSICNIFYNNSLQAEQLSDIAVGEKYVVIAGEDIRSAQVTLTRFFKNNLCEPMMMGYHLHYTYDYTSIVDMAPFMLYTDQVKISYMDSNKMAITTSAMRNNYSEFYTLTSVFDEHTLNIIHTQVVPHNEGMIYIKDTEYDSTTQQLYILEDNNFDNTDNLLSYIIAIKPMEVFNYICYGIKSINDCKIDDIVAMGLRGKFVGVGVDYNFYQTLFSKNVNNISHECNTSVELDALLMGPVSYNSSQTYRSQEYVINWNLHRFQRNILQQVIECQSIR
jgi:hypothetical protein